ncbi:MULTISPECIES: crossover junction endodeoxyribonuclease RuvC [unclassified Actinomyces]|uniref:crossover junction endodeoxyribonuclease RuvC n=2 Tax=Actinomyces TaxID=1654 RepID=UPI0020179D9E|nr:MULTISPECIES: crossover junction endodeoxyribonuclease RuvC [unclassified Actinomyces]MCL3778349.1 crossover junction endodeoxyribonuclease RuvC [Actinomyces sp. AC-20-1]MCL3790204.1 crossover junction endodeoxyribonuclease RuvC [Actinomyces sp. 187325]MCL3792485.1 crossover junction endodeoxyribonuclease RuvC [Actinomyces sp. 186855]MCL3794321.1 crossover junction endodeoxyribonuclease RuvC [Actinomyces sp. 217892]
MGTARSRSAVVAQQRVLGVDPGLTRCGLGCVDIDPRRRVRLVEVGVVRTPPSQSPELRLLAIAEALDDWIARLGPTSVSVERVFAQDNLRSVIGVAQVMGVAMLAGARHGLEVAQHTPSEAKAAVTGSGTADKPQVQAMVARILGLAEPPSPADAADALAQAICHGWRGGGTGADGATEMVSAGGAVRASARTPAQRQWAQAQAAARRTGAVDPRRLRR